MASDIFGVPARKVLLCARYTAEGSVFAALGLYFFSPGATVGSTLIKTGIFWVVMFVTGLICLSWMYRAHRMGARNGENPG